MGVRVIAVGESLAGDDGAGLAVLARLRADGVPDGVELAQARDATELIDLLAGPERVILIDAVVGGRPGELRDLAPDDVVVPSQLAISTHGIDVLQAIELARILGDAPAAAIRIVAVAIERPSRLGEGLSPAVADAVPRAAAHVRALLGS